MPINRAGFDKKMRRMSGEMRATLRALIRDGAAYLAARITDEVVNGPSGQNYPKSGYASGVSQGESGFVGVVSGGLKRSIQLHRETDLEWTVFSENVVAPYNADVDSWAREKYGMGFMDIAIELYSAGVLKLFAQELTRFVSAVSNDITYRYQNPFPA